MMSLSAGGSRLVCTFRLNGQMFGVDAIDVKEVSTETKYTRIAHAPNEVLGLVNLRGHIFLVVDLRRLLGTSATDFSADTRLILFKPSIGNAFGVVVDSIGEIERIDANQIEDFTATGRDSSSLQFSRTELISAVCKLPDELLVLLEPRRFLTSVERQFDQTS